MLFVRFEQLHSFAETQPPEYQLDLAEGIPAPLDVEEVARADGKESRLGSVKGHVIGVLHPGGDLSGDVLLGVLRANRGVKALQ